MKRDLVLAGKAIGGAGLTGAVLYLVATVPIHFHAYGRIGSSWSAFWAESPYTWRAKSAPRLNRSSQGKLIRRRRS